MYNHCQENCHANVHVAAKWLQPWQSEWWHYKAWHPLGNFLVTLLQEHLKPQTIFHGHLSFSVVATKMLKSCLVDARLSAYACYYEDICIAASKEKDIKEAKLYIL